MRRSDNIYQVDLIAALFGGFMITWLATTEEAETVAPPNRLAFATLELERVFYNNTGSVVQRIGLLPRSVAQRPGCAPDNIIKEITLSLPFILPCRVETIRDGNEADSLGRLQGELRNHCQRIAHDNRLVAPTGTSPHSPPKGRPSRDVTWKANIMALSGVNLALPKKAFIPLGTAQFEEVIGDAAPIAPFWDAYPCNINIVSGRAVSVFVTTAEVLNWLAIGKVTVGSELGNWTLQAPVPSSGSTRDARPKRYFFPYQEVLNQFESHEHAVSLGELQARLCLHEGGKAVCYQAKVEWALNAELVFVPESDA